LNRNTLRKKLLEHQLLDVNAQLPPAARVPSLSDSYSHYARMNALLSVSDKTGIVELAQALHAQGIKLLSTGGTAKLLADTRPAGDRSGAR